MAKLFKFVKWGAPTILFIRFNFFKNLFDFSKLDNFLGHHIQRQKQLDYLIKI